MYYGYTKLATDEKKNSFLAELLLRVINLLFFFLRANPDHEKLYPFVKSWLLEVDSEGQPVREIGLDENGEVLFCAPNRRNYGFWTDSDKKFFEKDLETVGKEVFESKWLD